MLLTGFGVPCGGCPKLTFERVSRSDKHYRTHRIFSCRDGSACYVEGDVCDGNSHCRNGEDEEDCRQPCRAVGRKYKCPGNNTKCIKAESICKDVENDKCPPDEEYQCPITEIWSNLPRYGKKSYYRFCPSRQSITLYNSQVCDGIMNCPGGEDEINCNKLCPASGFHCYSGKHVRCLHKFQLCLQCKDQQNEIDCDRCERT